MKRTAICLALIGTIVTVFLVLGNRPVLVVNAHILTMNESAPVATTMLMHNERIVAIGKESVSDAKLPRFTRTVDLKGRTVLPGFVDAHSHFPSTGLIHAGLDLNSPPVGSVATLQILIDTIASRAATVDAGDWIIGFNYDNASLDVARHPSRAELDRAAPNNPVYLWHRSGHMGVANSLALEALGYDDTKSKEFADQPDRMPDGTLTGLLQGGAAAPMAFLLRKISPLKLFDALRSSRDDYLEAGVTTAQNGFADIATMRLLLWMQRLGVVPQRLLLWPALEKVSQRIGLSDVSKNSVVSETALADSLKWGAQNEKYHIGALKLVVDGSPQGQTAWLTSPYLSNGELTLNKGVSAVSKSVFIRQVTQFHNAGFQLALHGNGDAAIDLIIEAVAEAQAQNPRPDARHMIVHGQLIRPDQLSKLPGLNLGVTFFPAHTFFWGDWYRNNILGEHRARAISPLALADTENVRYSIHSDAPVTPVDPLSMLWYATTRETLSGSTLGAEFAISRERALKAMTIDAAWQNHLDHDRGSLEVGKLADLVVLSDNPLSVPDVRDLEVQQVWIGGRREF